MSTLFTNNKQMMVHIVSEIVVLVGITFYFNQKNKKLMAHIEDLAQRVEEQEDLLQKHDQIIKQLVDHLSKQQAMTQQNIVQHSPKAPITTKQKVLSKHQVVQQAPVRVHFAQEEEEEEEEQEEEKCDSELETEADFDTELQEELNDLVDVTDDDLKKEQIIEKDA
jgi:hypothetical protein